MLKAARTTQAAMADSTKRMGRWTKPDVARLRVIECATMKAVAIFKTFTKTGRAAETRWHIPSRRRTPGNRKASREQ